MRSPTIEFFGIREKPFPNSFALQGLWECFLAHPLDDEAWWIINRFAQRCPRKIPPAPTHLEGELKFDPVKGEWIVA